VGPHPRKTVLTDTSELVLVLLRLYKEPIPGSLFMQKLAFISMKEVPELEHLLLDARYRGKQYGPFSGVLRDAVNGLTDRKLVVSRPVPSDRFTKDLIGLTTEGARIADQILRRLPPPIVRSLESKCRGAKQLGYAGLLRYVYVNYPDFTQDSEIRQKVFDSFGRYSY